MKKSILIKTALVAMALPLFAGCVTRVVYQPAPPPNAVVADPTPPPPQVEVIPAAPDPTFIWVGGEWVWRGRWVWYGGHWGPRPYPGAVWVHGAWGWRGHHRVWVASHWR
ncbi:MAG: hypothetical protein ABSE48_05115 [Verrucomicrobiota bacterium]